MGNGNVLTAVLSANGLNFGERASTAGIVTLEGMAVIFIVLALLWGIIELLHRTVSKAGKKSAEPAKEAVPAEQPAAVSEEPAQSGATVAAIIAAISAMRAEEGTTGGFRVVSFTRVNGHKNRT